MLFLGEARLEGSHQSVSHPQVKRSGLIEHGGIGGQCLHFGCMPVCALNDVARFIHSARLFIIWGLLIPFLISVFQQFFQRCGQSRKRSLLFLDTETRSAGVNIIYGKTGRLEGKKVFAEDEQMDADAVIAATGSRPHIPDIEGIDLKGVYTPHTLFGMKELPKKLVIVGGGVMAAEFAYIFSMFGSEVTIISRSAFLKNTDKHLRALAIRELEGVKISEDTSVQSISGRSHIQSVRVRADNKDDID